MPVAKLKGTNSSRDKASLWSFGCYVMRYETKELALTFRG